MEASRHRREQQRVGRRFSQEQYDMLKRCSDKKDMTEWNEWRRANPDEDVLLESADLSRFCLKGSFLNTSKVIDYKGTVVNTHELNKVDLKYKIDPRFRFNPNKIQDYSGKVYLEGAYLFAADLESANLVGAHLEGARLTYANLRDANLRIAYLRGVIGDNASLEKTNLYFSKLEGARFPRALVDSSTLLWGCIIDRKTDFSSVSLETMRIQPSNKELLSYNTRRKYWERWYTFLDWDGYPGCDEKRGVLGKALRWPIRVFWWTSDYGRSVGRIVLGFFVLALMFAAIYYLYGVLNPPGIVSSLLQGKEGPVPGWLVPVRTIYFSIVTMTTLGFGDMHANCQSFWGHLLLTLQVILGYVLLGALVTRFAVLFTAGGPAGKFVKETKATEETEEHRENR